MVRLGWRILGLCALAGMPLPGAAATAGASAHAVLERLLGRRAAEFHLVIEADSPGRDWYQVVADDHAVMVRGSSAVAVVHGAYVYLQTHGLAEVDQDSQRLSLPDRWPREQGPVVRTPFGRRAYLNPCTYGYTTPWWTWQQWQREIDWMALHGFDMPLALEGQEAVWQQLWLRQGVSPHDVAAYFSGPAYAPWQRMGNLEGQFAPLSQRWIGERAQLQRQILDRVRSLGMQPVLPAFAGYVPKAYALAHPEAHIYRMRPWEGFHETYWLDPSDPLFKTLARQFIELYTRAYGTGRYYLADAFNEMLPPMSDHPDGQTGGYGDNIQATAAQTRGGVSDAVRDRRLAAYGKALYASIGDAAPGATWVIQSWLFGADQHFWSPAAIDAFLRDIPRQHLLVLDIGNDRYPMVWHQAAAFHGRPWIYGYVFNYGGSNPLYGDLQYYRDDLASLLANPGHGNLQGFGLFPEGLAGTPVVYEYLSSLAWEGPSQSLQEWLPQYLMARYGHVEPGLVDAWTSLQDAALKTRYWTPRWWQGTAGAYLFFRRPGLMAERYPASPGNMAALRQALRQFLALAPHYAGEPLFQQDLADVARHYASLQIDQALPQVIEAYLQHDLAAGDRAWQRVHDLALQADALTAAPGASLAAWTAAAAADAHSATDRAAYLHNARALITVWGGDGNLPDYASRAWPGMYRSFYLPRWALYVHALRQAMAAGRRWDEAPVRREITGWERAWTREGVYQAPPQEGSNRGHAAQILKLAAVP
ncbi:alpha-N-acetylglucosaminidase [Frateuria aurantia]